MCRFDTQPSIGVPTAGHPHYRLKQPGPGLAAEKQICDKVRAAVSVGIPLPVLNLPGRPTCS